MTKTKYAEIKILSAGYKIEYTDYYKGKKFIKAIKESKTIVTATNIISLAKLLNIDLNK